MSAILATRGMVRERFDLAASLAICSAVAGLDVRSGGVWQGDREGNMRMV